MGSGVATGVGVTGDGVIFTGEGVTGDGVMFTGEGVFGDGVVGTEMAKGAAVSSAAGAGVWPAATERRMKESRNFMVEKLSKCSNNNSNNSLSNKSKVLEGSR